MGWIHDIGTYLQTQSIGTIGTDMFYGRLQKGKMNCIALIDRPGLDDIVTLGNDMTLSRPELGVLVRAKTGDTAKQKADSIYDILHLQRNTRIGNTRFKKIKGIARPYQISSSETEGTEYSVNFEIEMSV